MATRYLAAGATDLNTTASWSATYRGVTGASVPTANDVVYIYEGDQIINTNLATLDVDLNGVVIGPEFRGSLGTPGASATIGCSGTTRATLEIQSQSAYINIAAGTAGIDVLKITSPTNVRLTGGTTVELQAHAGQLYIGSSAVVTSLFNSGSVTEAIDGTAFTTLIVDGGFVKDYRGATTAHVYSIGRLVALVDAAYTTANVGGMPGSSGAVLNHRAQSTITTLNLYGGTYSVEGNVGTPTLTTANIYGRAGTTSYIYKFGTTTASVGTENDYSLGAKMAFAGGGTTGGGIGGEL